MPAHSMKLVTIVCEALARDAVTRLLRDVGAHGYTLFEVEGLGAKGPRTLEMVELANIQIEVLVPPAVCDRLMDELETRFFPTYAMIAHETDVSVRRPDKF
ncbi:MAG: transcriptional regulator [Candidatus Hydrogenedentes bacterium]|nr:transcriptional regulator [Candidatus Hydrogenedentota bacterium]